jgi:phosphatidylserine/phosphatidylglycerophosphate/cardiolipin synthase-like enzyme
VLLDGNRYTMHHKFFVVDGQIVVTGSYNFSNAAEKDNNENVLILHNPDIAAQYTQEFLRVWQKAEGR